MVVWIIKIYSTKDYRNNKTGLQPVSRPVEQILGFSKRFKKGTIFKEFENGAKPAQNVGTAKSVTKPLETE